MPTKRVAKKPRRRPAKQSQAEINAAQMQWFNVRLGHIERRMERVETMMDRIAAESLERIARLAGEVLSSMPRK